jgi:hypothetical protein
VDRGTSGLFFPFFVSGGKLNAETKNKFLGMNRNDEFFMAMKRFGKYTMVKFLSFLIDKKKTKIS